MRDKAGDLLEDAKEKLGDRDEDAEGSAETSLEAGRDPLADPPGNTDTLTHP